MDDTDGIAVMGVVEVFDASEVVACVAPPVVVGAIVVVVLLTPPDVNITDGTVTAVTAITAKMLPPIATFLPVYNTYDK